MTPLYGLSAQQLLAGYRQRDFSPVEVMQSVLARIDRWEPQLCATYLLRPERALALAQQSE
ncbi:MAG: amidase, partial [Rhodoferax sp.]|nr:amidase [Rhodoferax sp.]